MTVNSVVPDNSLAWVLKLASINEAAMQVQHPALFKLMSDVHDGMMSATEPPLVGGEVPTLLVLQAQQYYIAAVRLAAAGMVTSIFPLLRAGLECIAYAVLTEGSQDNSLVWVRRNDSDEALRACRTLFIFSKGSKKLRELDSDLADRYDFLYQASIEHGAHPNIQGVMSSVTSTITTPGERSIHMRMVHGMATDETYYAMDAVIRFGAAIGGGICHALPKNGAAHDAYNRFGAVWNEIAKLTASRQLDERE